MRMTVGELASHAEGRVAIGDPGTAVRSFGFDSRDLAPGSCFVALRGHRDGHDFVDEALARGAVVALVSRTVPLHHAPHGALVLVDDTIAALGRVARRVRSARADLDVVAVAGSTGKTSTKDLLAGILSGAGRVAHANPESFNNEFGLPITLLNMPARAHVVVTEMGERFPGDIAALCAIASPTVGVVTNVGLAHAEHLGGREGAARAMAELIESLSDAAVAVLNADDEHTPWLASRSAARVITVGTAADADVVVADLRVDDDLRPSFELDGTRYHVPLRGAHQAHNAALAVVVARELGLAAEQIASALAHARPSRWRMEIDVSDAGVTVVNDAYNANPASMDAALHALARLPVAGRRIAVLGDMRELGPHAADAHAEIGRLSATLGVDVVVGVGAGGAAIATAAGGGAATHRVDDAAAALALVREIVAPGDAVLVKASRALHLERVAAALLDDAPVNGRGGAS
ncbi:MAG TPA: UDP-N-acetylmuramoyl-tripeptide--D-alanyl-D-alanine ligase [Acidimicrobiia bacterium]|nr:UDP-N-acetylmuramoyl-tripeptide--D-alanyl-D-alanine ligase [Acidimicrobiia bacterium]